MADFKILINVEDIGVGDIDDLTDDINDLLEPYEKFTMIVSQKVGTSYFSREIGDDLIES
jgi:hypothetical protein